MGGTQALTRTPRLTNTQTPPQATTIRDSKLRKGVDLNLVMEHALMTS